MTDFVWFLTDAEWLWNYYGDPYSGDSWDTYGYGHECGNSYGSSNGDGYGNGNGVIYGSGYIGRGSA